MTNFRNPVLYSMLFRMRQSCNVIFSIRSVTGLKLLTITTRFWQEYREAKDSFTLIGKTQFECAEAISLFFKVYLQNVFFPSDLGNETD